MTMIKQALLLVIVTISWSKEIVADGSSSKSYVGCYVDQAVRGMNGKLIQGQNKMTVESCQQFCNGYNYYGVEWAQECYCSNQVSTYGLAQSDSDCNMKCLGNQNEVCGGNWRLSVYRKPNSVQYAGCYVDNSQRGMNMKLIQGQNTMTVESCQQFCNGYNFFGVEWAQECYCSNQVSTYGLAQSDSDCNMKCLGNKNEVCGGNWRLSVYRSPTAPQYLGCFVDAAQRGMSAKLIIGQSQSMTIESCSQFCSGFTYFGTEWSQECYCSNSVSTLGSANSDAECNMKCAANQNEICGGNWRLSVYHQ
jgi:glucan endo-1,3-alpha-glucosidase